MRAYDGDLHGPIAQEVIVKSGQVSAAAGDKLELGVDLGGEGSGALDNVKKLLILLIQLIALGIQMLDDLGRAMEGGGRGDVVKSSIGGQQRRIWGSKELPVDRRRGHDGLLGMRRGGRGWEREMRDC